MQQDEYFQDIEIIKDDIDDIFDLDKLTENNNDNDNDNDNDVKTKNIKLKILKVVTVIISVGLIICSIVIFI